MQRRQPGAAAFAGSNGEHGLVQVDIAALECQRLVDPQPGGRDQPEKGDVAVGSQPSGRGQPRGCIQQIGDLCPGIDVWRFAVPGRAQQPGVGDLGGPVDGGQVAQEATHHRQPAGWIARIERGGRGRPAQARFERDRTRVAFVVQVPAECAERTFLRGRAVAQSSTQRDELLHTRCHRTGRSAGHDPAPAFGQGSGTSRKRPISTAA